MKKMFMVLGVIFSILIVVYAVIAGVTFLKERQYSPSAEAFVDVFYENFNNQNTEYIYNEMTDNVFRAGSSLEDVQKFFSLFYEKLGNVKSRKKTAWKVFHGSGGCFYTIEYKVSHEITDSTDSFVLKREGDSWLLQKYNTNCKELLF